MGERYMECPCGGLMTWNDHFNTYTCPKCRKKFLASEVSKEDGTVAIKLEPVEEVS